MKYMMPFRPFLENYKEDWMKPNSDIREGLEFDINQILIWLKDYGYRYMISGWIGDSPYIWIKIDKSIGKEEEVLEAIETIKNYLNGNGYKFWINEINKDSFRNHQFYINFNKN